MGNLRPHPHLQLVCRRAQWVSDVAQALRQAFSRASLEEPVEMKLGIQTCFISISKVINVNHYTTLPLETAAMT